MKDVYSKDEVIEILRQVMFGGTPDLYDNGGLHGNINIPNNYTMVRAVLLLEKYSELLSSEQKVNKEK